MMDKIRLGFVGCGFNGQIGFLENFYKNSKCIILGLAEVREKLRSKVSKKYNIKYQYSSHKDLVKDINEYDGIVIITKRNMTPAIAYEFLKLKKPILTEKPMASSLKQAKKLLYVASKNNTLYKIAYNKTYDEGVQKAKFLFKKLVKNKILGNLIFIKSHRLSGNGYDKKNFYIKTKEKNFINKPKWQSRPEWLAIKYSKSYEKYLNLYCHNINLLKYFTNKKPNILFSDLSDKKISTVVFDYGKFSAVLETGFFTTDGWDETFEMYFEKGSLKVNLPPQHLKNRSAQILLYKNKIGKITKNYVFNSWSFQRQADAFVADIIANKIKQNSVVDVVEDIEIVEKIWKSFLHK